jgi:hypothetical protein
LLPEVGAGIDHQSLSVDLHHRGGSESVISMVIRATHMTSTTYNRYALGCSGT